MSVDTKMREEDIYEWFGQQRKTRRVHESRTRSASSKSFSTRAEAYGNFVHAPQCARRGHEHGVWNTRALGGRAIKQHFILLMAGRHLSIRVYFSRLANNIEQSDVRVADRGRVGKGI